MGGNEKFCMFLPANRITDLEIYVVKKELDFQCDGKGRFYPVTCLYSAKQFLYKRFVFGQDRNMVICKNLIEAGGKSANPSHSATLTMTEQF